MKKQTHIWVLLWNFSGKYQLMELDKMGVSSKPIYPHLSRFVKVGSSTRAAGNCCLWEIRKKWTNALQLIMLSFTAGLLGIYIERRKKEKIERPWNTEKLVWTEAEKSFQFWNDFKSLMNVKRQKARKIWSVKCKTENRFFFTTSFPKTSHWTHFQNICLDNNDHFSRMRRSSPFGIWIWCDHSL